MHWRRPAWPAPICSAPSARRSNASRPEGRVVNRLVGTAGVAAALLIAGCGRRADVADKPAVPADSGRITVDSAQRARFHIAAIDSATFSPTILTTGTVAFSSDRSTQV